MRLVTVGKLSSSGQLIDGGEAARRTGGGGVLPPVQRLHRATGVTGTADCCQRDG